MPSLPISPAERSPLPDVLRGLAIGGILLVNLSNFAGYTPWAQDGADGAAQGLIDFFANGKFISTFALLFGAGAALSVQRSGARTQLRRLAALFLIGALHGALIWEGDILTNYALIGGVFLLLTKLPRRLTLPLAAVLIAVSLWPLLQNALSYGGNTSPAGFAFTPAYTSPDYSEALRTRVAGYLSILSFGTFNLGGWLLGMFLIGRWAAQGGVLQGPGAHVRLLRRAALFGWLIGVPLNLAFAVLSARNEAGAQTWALFLRFTGGPVFALAFAASIALLLVGGRGRWLTPLAGVGRLALSNYLFDSVVCTLIFYGYGLGQYGRWGALACLIFGLTLFGLQVWLSNLYLRFFARGPAETVLRTLTYGRVRRPAAQ